MVLYKVCSTPTDAMTLTNLVYLPPKTLARGVEWKIELSGYVFNLAEDALIPEGCISLNARQRNITRLSTTVDSIPLTFFKPQNVPSLYLVQLSIDFSGRPQHGTSSFIVDVSSFTLDLRGVLQGQILSTHQCLVTLHRGRTLIVTVHSVRDEETEDSQVTTTRGWVTSRTNLHITHSTSKQIHLVNYPEGMNPSPSHGLFPGGFTFEQTGIGGLDAQLEEIFRRAFESRLYPRSIIQKLKIRHVKGVLLHGPPGTGKTLIARRLASMLGCKNISIVNGPELFDKYVGQTESNIRQLFAAAESEQRQIGEDSALHIIVFDEFDAMVKRRGSTPDGTGVKDSAVNQLLSKIDGPEELNNVLLLAMTNRKDLIDEAILRPGRFEVQVEITIPDEKGRLEIFQIQTKNMREHGLLHSEVNLTLLASRTQNYTGAEIEGIVNNAVSFATHRHVDIKNPTSFINPEALQVTHSDFEQALGTYIPMFGWDANELNCLTRKGLSNYGKTWENLLETSMSCVKTLQDSPRLQLLSLLLEGPHGTGKTVLAAHIAKQSSFPCIKLVTPSTFVGYTDLAKCNAIAQVFDAANRSGLSIVLLDDLERLIDFVPVGMRFSNSVLQTLLILLKKLPSRNNKLFILGTSSNPDLMRELELHQCFDFSCLVPPLGRPEVKKLWEKMQIYFPSEDEQVQIENLFPTEVPIKRLLVAIEYARSIAEQNGNVKGPTYFRSDHFVHALG